MGDCVVGFGEVEEYCNGGEFFLFVFDDVVDDGGDGHGAVRMWAESVGERGDDVVGG